MVGLKLEMEMERRMEMKLDRNSTMLLKRNDFKYYKNIFHTEKKFVKIFENNGSWNPVMHGCQFPDFVQSCQMSKFGYFPEWL